MTKDAIVNRLKSRFGPDLELLEMNQPEPYFYISGEKYHELCAYLKKDPELDFDFLFQLGGVHYPGERFEVVLCLASHSRIHEIVVKVKLDINNPKIITITDIWQAANWFEREAMELFGINFLNHPDPRPLLLYDDWQYGYPMRKGWSGPDFVPMPEK
jgi:NADH-quinone oxidoreductase subunit C